LKVEVDTLRACLKRLRIEIPAERIQEELETSFETIQKNAQIPGFRRSRAPKAVVRARYGEAARADVLNKLVPEACQQAIEETGISVVGEMTLHPPIEQMQIVPGENLAFALEVEVKPEIALPDLSTLEVDKRPVDVSTDEVETYLTSLRESHAEFHDLETPRPVEPSDAVYVSWVERDAETNALLHEYEEVLLEPARATKEGYYRAVLEAVIGMQQGESKTITFQTNPDDASAPQTTSVTITVQRIGKRVVPELDDTFARSLNYENVAHLRSGLWNLLVERAKRAKREAQQRELMDQLIARTSFEVPESVILQQQRDLFVSVLEERRRAGTDTTEEELVELFDRLRDSAEKIIRRNWLVEEIAKAYNIAVRDDEVSLYLRQEARTTGQDPDKLEARIRAMDRWEYLRNELRAERVLDLMIETAREKRQLIY